MKPEFVGIGAPARRKEDFELATGTGRFLADIVPDGMAHAVFLRSPMAHASFTIDDLSAARAIEGVIGVYTAEDISSLGSLPVMASTTNRDGSTPFEPDHPLLARGTVRHVGEPIVLIVAETDRAGRDALEAIEITFDELELTVEMKHALAPDAPLLWPEIGSNVAFDAEVGDAGPVDEAFKTADRVIELELVNNRVITNYMETRGCLGEFDEGTGRYTLTVSSQGVHLIQPILASKILNVAKDKVRVVTPHVGGGFGTKYFTYHEYALTLFAAKKLGRPVRWIADRTEHFLADYHGRDNISKAELAVDEKGRFLAIRVDTLANMGAYLSQLGPFIPMIGSVMVPGCYRTPAVHVRVRGVYTNTVPVDAYRGAGRPEASYLIERLVDKAARDLGIPPDIIRKRNFITPSMMPFETPTGRVYDTGDFAGIMASAFDIADKKGFNKRRRASRKQGKLRGFGFATYIEACAAGAPEHATVTLDENGGATIAIGTQSQGQGHDTAYSQVLSETLGLPLDRVTVIQGDTDKVARGYGTGGSRSIPVGGSSVSIASEVLAKRIKMKAADQLEAAPEDLELSGGEVIIAGTDRKVPLAEIVATLDLEDRTAAEDWQPPAPTFPNGAHVIEVEIDKDTCIIEIVNYVIVDDFGVTLNPVMLEGQIHGGVAQGVGQAMLEHVVHDPDSGQLLTASFMDYCMPRADNAPEIHFETRNIPCKTNHLGMKGAGEAGSIGACPALVNAVVDALDHAYGIKTIDMPMTPERVWLHIQEGEASLAG